MLGQPRKVTVTVTVEPEPRKRLKREHRKKFALAPTRADGTRYRS